MALYNARSAMSFIDNVTTPTLILHGGNDERVPTGQAYELFRGLKDRGKTDRAGVLSARGPRHHRVLPSEGSPDAHSGLGDAVHAGDRERRRRNDDRQPASASPTAHHAWLSSPAAPTPSCWRRSSSSAARSRPSSTSTSCSKRSRSSSRGSRRFTRVRGVSARRTPRRSAHRLRRRLSRTRSSRTSA